MLGAIIGDIAGSRYEFNPCNDYHLELFGPDADYTDDTICTIAVADAILRDRSYGDNIHKWCRRYPDPKGGYGGRFRQWVMSGNPEPYGSFGNGSAMRVSPVGWWFDSVQEVVDESRKTAECTHNHPQGINGAEAVALAIYDCRRLRANTKGEEQTPEEIKRVGLRRAISYYTDNAAMWSLNLDDYRNRFDETCQGTVPVALQIIIESRGFEDAIRKAVSLGADADTLGAITGSIAEALWGIPDWMKERAMGYLPLEMRKVIEEFNRRQSHTLMVSG